MRECERRREKRRAAAGDLWLTVDGRATAEVRALLVDVSESGFRAAHECAGLGAGQVVGFHSDLASGRARVMWTRVLGPSVESGFLVIG
jgi:hypothetical protein